MKTLLVKVLAGVGLVPAGRYAALAQRVHQLKDESRAWKKRAEHAAARLHGLEKQHRRELRELKVAQRGAQKASRHAPVNGAELQTQLADAERALIRAREQLMAIEVKLDILEGAANILDARTRADGPQR